MSEYIDLEYYGGPLGHRSHLGKAVLVTVLAAIADELLEVLFFRTPIPTPAPTAAPTMIATIAATMTILIGVEAEKTEVAQLLAFTDLVSS